MDEGEGEGKGAVKGEGEGEGEGDGEELRGHGPGFEWVHHVLWSTLDRREHPCRFGILGGRTECMVCRIDPRRVVGVGSPKLLMGDAHPWWCRDVVLTATTMGHQMGRK